MTETTELTTQEKARIMRNAYRREWARKNRDKIRASQERTFAKKYDQMLEQMIEELKNDPDVRAEIDDDLLEAIARNYIKNGISIDDFKRYKHQYIERCGDLNE